MVNPYSCDVLVVDDEPDTLLLAKKLLEMEKYSIQTASNGDEALDLIKNRGVLPRLILLDIMMPKRDGWSVLEALKNDIKTRNIKVIIFTVKAFSKDIERAKELGADGYIRKPFRGDILLQYVREKMQQ